MPLRCCMSRSMIEITNNTLANYNTQTVAPPHNRETRIRAMASVEGVNVPAFQVKLLARGRQARDIHQVLLRQRVRTMQCGHAPLSSLTLALAPSPLARPGTPRSARVCSWMPPWAPITRKHRDEWAYDDRTGWDVQAAYIFLRIPYTLASTI